MDAWLYETCTQCLQHMVDIVVQFYDALQPLLSRIFDLLANFIRSALALSLQITAEPRMHLRISSGTLHYLIFPASGMSGASLTWQASCKACYVRACGQPPSWTPVTL